MVGPYFKADIPSIHIDYKGLIAYARKVSIKILFNKNCHILILLKKKIFKHLY